MLSVYSYNVCHKQLQIKVKNSVYRISQQLSRAYVSVQLLL